MKKWEKITITLAAIIVGAEISIRLAGMLDFPIYEKDVAMGYIQTTNQSGAFLRKNQWKIDDLHLFGQKYDVNLQPSVFLIGDSIVWGGNSFKLEDHLCVSLEKKLNQKVWSAAAGGWSSWNEIAYTKRFPDVVDHCNAIVWVFNSDDFTLPAVWDSESTHPTKHPLSGILYLSNKYIFPKFHRNPVSDKKVSEINFQQLEATVRYIREISKNKKVIVALWPTRYELDLPSSGQDYDIVANGLSRLSSENIEFIDIRATQVLKKEYYKDDIHPNIKGVDTFSTLLTERLRTKKNSETVQLMGATAR